MQASEVDFEKIAVRKYFNRFEEVFFYEDKVGIFGICDFLRGSKNGTREDQ